MSFIRENIASILIKTQKKLEIERISKINKEIRCIIPKLLYVLHYYTLFMNIEFPNTIV
jgi:hypothetical protein